MFRLPMHYFPQMACSRDFSHLLSLSEAHSFLAFLVANGRHEYLPIFERLEIEIQAKQRQDLLIERAKQVAHQKKPTLDNHSAF